MIKRKWVGKYFHYGRRPGRQNDTRPKGHCPYYLYIVGSEGKYGTYECTTVMGRFKMCNDCVEWKNVIRESFEKKGKSNESKGRSVRWVQGKLGSNDAKVGRVRKKSKVPPS